LVVSGTDPSLNNYNVGVYPTLYLNNTLVVKP